MMANHSRKVKTKGIEVGDLVLRKALFHPSPEEGKLSSNWEGPYKVVDQVRPGTYHLSNLQGFALPNAWNAEHLKRYFVNIEQV